VKKIYWTIVMPGQHMQSRRVAWRTAISYVKAAIHIVWCLLSHPGDEEVDP